MGPVINQLVPAGVATAETGADQVDAELYPEEERSLGPAVEKRRHEFVAGRACARHALAQLGIGPTPIPSGEHGEPLWPAGVVGSITHCRGYRACAVARAERVVTLGIDAEVHEPLPDGVFEQVTRRLEQEWTAAHRGWICVDRLLFSAKEAVYKAWFPLAGRWLGFDDVEVSIDLRHATFRARLLVPGLSVEGEELTELHGRWRVARGVVVTAVVLLR